MTSMMAKACPLVFLAACLTLQACGQESPQPAAEAGGETATPAQDGDLVLARVDDEPITLEQFRQFYEDIPDYLQSGRAGVDQVRDHVQTLVDMKLLELEAVDQGVDKEPRFLSKTTRQRMDRLVGLYIVDRIKIRLSPADVRRHWEGEGLSRTIRIGQILTSSLDSAQAALRDISSGASFSEAARMWSTHNESAEQGGDSGRYINRLDLPPALGDRLFALKEGEISEPVDLNGAFGVFTLLAEFEADLDEERFRALYQQMYMERSVAQRRALVDSLQKDLAFTLDEKALDQLIEIIRRGDWDDPAAGSLAVYTFRGGQITGADVIQSVDPVDRGGLRRLSAASMIERMQRTLVPDATLLAAAEDAGYAKRPDIATWLKRRRQEELIVQLRVKILNERIEITEEEIRAEYDANPERYTRPELITLEEVLVATEEEASAVRARIEAGESIADLARQMTLRSPEHRDDNGRISLTLADGRYLGRLAASAYRTQPGELVGPLPVAEGFSVYRLLDRKTEPATFEQSRRRAKATVNWIKKQIVFEDFLKDLRTKYADRVKFNEDGLQRAATSGA